MKRLSPSFLILRGSSIRSSLNASSPYALGQFMKQLHFRALARNSEQQKSAICSLSHFNWRPNATSLLCRPPLEVSRAKLSTKSTKLGLLSSSCHLPAASAAVSGGKDFHFVDDDKGTIGIFDAVGQWHAFHAPFNVTEYPHALMNQAKQNLYFVDSIKCDMQSNRGGGIQTEEEEEDDEWQDEEEEEDNGESEFEDEEERMTAEKDEVVMEVRQMRQLMKEKRQLPRKERKGLLLQRYSVEQLLPLEILTRSRDRVHEEKVRGVSTAMLLMLSNPQQQDSNREGPDAELSCANLGDSAFLVIRDGKKFYRSSQDYLQFNEPSHFGSAASGNINDSDIKLKSVRVQAGDIIVAGSNGLFDNMWDQEIVEFVNAKVEELKRDPFFKVYGNEQVDPQVVAEELAAKAVEQSRNTDKKSPYAEYVEKSGYHFAGGRDDDVTVVVSFVVPEK